MTTKYSPSLAGSAAIAAPLVPAVLSYIVPTLSSTSNVTAPLVAVLAATQQVTVANSLGLSAPLISKSVAVFGPALASSADVVASTIAAAVSALPPAAHGNTTIFVDTVNGQIVVYGFSVRTGRLKWWNGSAWVSVSIKHFNQTSGQWESDRRVRAYDPVHGIWVRLNG